MRLDLPQKIDKEQWLQRLGVKGEIPEGLEQQLDMAEKKLFDAAMPQGVFRVISKSAMDMPGTAVRKHLSECEDMILMAVTLGAGIDRLIRMSQIRDMAEAVLLDSGASVLAEQICDELEVRIREENDGFITPRYSPGYGDFPVEMQSQLIKVLEGYKTIGLSVNESHILTPRKSITAVAGIADHPVTGYLASCEECLIREKCSLKKEGKKCWT